MGYAKEIATLAAGPILNLVIFIACSLLSNTPESYVATFGYVNLLTAISNLLPIEGYDGYGILNKAFEVFNLPNAVRVLLCVSFSLTVLLTFSSLYLLLTYGEGYWMFGMFFLLLVGKIREFTKQS